MPHWTLLGGAREIYQSTAGLRRGPWRGVLFAIGAVSAGALLRFLLGGILLGSPYATMFPALLVTAFLCGWRPGLFAGVIGAAIAWFYWVLPEPMLLRTDTSSWIGLGFYALTSSVILLLIAGVHRSFDEFAETERTKQSINEELERRVAARTEQLERAYHDLKAEAASRAAAEAQVRQLQKMDAIGQLTGGVAHDFNNMLAVIVGWVQLARRHLERDREQADSHLGKALESARHASQLTSRLLAFSRQAPLAPAVLDPNRLVADMSEMLRRTLGEPIQLETVLVEGGWRTRADASQLENAIVNLCVNARDAMPRGGRLTIEVANAYLENDYATRNLEVTPGQYVLIAVTDTGAGMPAEVIERAFEPFFTTKGPGAGAGLGLSQVYGFVKQSGGHAKIYSETGKGTTVKLYLPRHEGELQQAPAETQASGAAAGSPGEVVLLVEDNERVRGMSDAALRELGYTVIEAASGEEALAVLARQPRIDLLLTDVIMPDMSGRELADRARASRPGLNVLYTTGYAPNVVVDSGIEVLIKPFTIEQLAQKARKAIDH
jgi:signal transduction histidine kinase/CheY-like chemotaxis protein